MKRVPMSVKEFAILKDQRCGICKQCRGIVWGDMDESAVDQPCDKCNISVTYGMDQAFKSGLILITETDFVFIKG